MSRVVPGAVNEVRLVINRHRFGPGGERIPKITGDIRELFPRFPDSDPLNYNCLTAAARRITRLARKLSWIEVRHSARADGFLSSHPRRRSFPSSFRSSVSPLHPRREPFEKRDGRGSAGSNSSRTVILELISETAGIFEGPLAGDKGTRGTAFKETFSWPLISRILRDNSGRLRRATGLAFSPSHGLAPLISWSRRPPRDGLYELFPGAAAGRRLNRDGAAPR